MYEKSALENLFVAVNCMNSMKSENKLDGASNFRVWKTRIDLILAKNKVLDIVKGKIVNQSLKKEKRKNNKTLQL
jgi:hypothetical protein